jgi:ADP-heptose:LPS heptosyltransferase
LGVRAELRDRLASVAGAVTVLDVERGAGAVHAAAAYARAAGLRLTRPALWQGARLHPTDSPTVQQLLGPLPRPLLAIHRGAGAAAKRWSPAAFAAVAARWRRSGGGVFELLGPAEADDAAMDGAVVVREWPLLDIAALLARVDAFLGNDSGVSHLAAAVGARTVVVFTATASRRWRPLGPRVWATSHPSVGRVLAALAPVESLTSTYPGSSVRPSTESARLRESDPAASPASSEDVRSVSRADSDERPGGPSSPREYGH